MSRSPPTITLPPAPNARPSAPMLRQLGLLLVLVALVIAEPLRVLYSEIDDDLEFIERELVGLDMLQVMRPLLRRIPEHRGMSFGMANGDETFHGPVLSLRRQIDSAMQVLLDPVTQRRMNELGIDSAQLSDIERRWVDLRIPLHDSPSINADEYFAAHNALMDALINLIRDIGDHSHLILEPRLSEYYLASSLIKILPGLTDSIGRVRGYATGMAARSELSAMQRNHLQSYLSAISYDISDLQHSIRFIDSQPNTQQAPNERAQQAMQKLHVFDDTVRQALLDQAFHVRTDELFKQGSDIIADLLFIFDVQFSELHHKLLQRHNEKRQLINYSLLKTAAISLALVLFVYFTVLRKLERLAHEKQQAQRQVEIVAQFHRAMEASPIAMLSIDQNLNIALSNQQAQSLFGYSEEQLHGMPVNQLLPEYAQQQHLDVMQAFITDPQSFDLSGARQVTCRSKSGRQIPVEIMLNYVADSAGFGIIASITDIRERLDLQHQLAEKNRHEKAELSNLIEQASDELAQNKRLLQMVLDRNGFAYWFFDLKNNKRWFSPNGYRILGYATNEIMDLQDWDDIVHPDDKDALYKDFNALVNGDIDHYVNRHRVRNTAGDYRWIEAHAAIWQQGDDHQVDMIVGVFSDVSDTVEIKHELEDSLRRLRQSNEELETFSYSVSHDLRAPLRAIEGFSKILSVKHADQLDENGLDMLSRVRMAAQRMGHIIDDILVLSRVTRADLQARYFDLSQLANEVILNLRDVYPAYHIEAIVQPDLQVWGDPKLIRLALENLLGNAWKFTLSSEQPRVEFGCQLINDETTYFVRDNGAGFEMRYARKLFLPFQRLHTAEEFPGTGVGLATVARVIQKHGGEIRGEGAVGQGACFYFTLPTLEA